LIGIEELHECLRKRLKLDFDQERSRNTYVALGLGDVAANVLESGEEFVGIALSVTILGVHGSEGSSETSDSLGTSSSELGAHLVENYIKLNGLATIILFEYLASLPYSH
jgi:hypothetical protein